jgi:hypothetical protein
MERAKRRVSVQFWAPFLSPNADRSDLHQGFTRFFSSCLANSSALTSLPSSFASSLSASR